METKRAEILEISTDLVIVGSGLAGLFAALAADDRDVVLVTKGRLGSSNSFQAQGGIAAAVGNDDSPQFHLEDTIRVGGGLCVPAAVAAVAAEAPARIGDLVRMGVRFDGDPGPPDLALEAGHSRRRVLHAGGAATGARVIDTLARRLQAEGRVRVLEHARLTSLAVVDGACQGVECELEDGTRVRVRAAATLLASGGPCGLYRRTTNPSAATGDGLALAHLAGAELADLEFVQFHPTAVVGHGIDGWLISEAVRGEGGRLVDEHGERFMQRYDSAAELAPRDVVARAVRQERVAGRETFISMAHLKPEIVEARFPNLVSTLAAAGLDLAREPIPVAPAAHFMMGGVRTGLHGETSVEGLFAVGEVACHGTHGANRLASNGLLECLVFARRAVDAAAGRGRPADLGWPPPRPMLPQRTDWPAPSGRSELGELLDLHAGVVRDARGLGRLLRAMPPVELGTLHEVVARLLAESALFREESRGAHSRADFPDTQAELARHTILRRGQGPRLEAWQTASDRAAL